VDSVSDDVVSWRKSTFSVETDCVAICRLPDGSVGVRNTNDVDGKVLAICPADLADLLTRIKAGELDDLV
jgi:hypothetical protein